MSQAEQPKPYENWLPVPGYEGLYIVSDFGRVKRIKRNQGTKPREFLRPFQNKDGYLLVDLRDMGRATFSVHRLVAAAFLGQCPKGYQVNHRDLDKKNNCVENLEYVTHQENMIHANRNGHSTGWEKRPVKRLSDGRVFASLAEAAREVGGDAGNLWSVLKGWRKTFKGSRYAYHG